MNAYRVTAHHLRTGIETLLGIYDAPGPFAAIQTARFAGDAYYASKEATCLYRFKATPAPLVFPAHRD